MREIGFLSPKLPSLQSCGIVIWQGTDLITVSTLKKGTTEDEMVGWHHRLDGHGFGWTPGVGDVQGGLACFGSWGCKESDMTERLK